MIRLLISITFLSLSFVDSFYLLLGEKDSDRSMRSLLDRDFSKGKNASLIILENPMCIRGWSNRGDMRLFLGNFQGAKSDYEKKNDPIGSTA